MMPATKHFDPVTGIDTHIVVLPPPAPPAPLPHPFVGMLFDPADAPMQNATVTINNMPRAFAGLVAMAQPPHIPTPPGTAFVAPAFSDGELQMGSSKVTMDGDAAGFTGMPVLTCQSVGQPALPRMNSKKKGKAKGLVLPTSVALAIPAGLPVTVGAPPTQTLMPPKGGGGGGGAPPPAMAAGMKRLNDQKQESGEQKREEAAAEPEPAPAAAQSQVPPEQANRNAAPAEKSTNTGHPVDVATGKVMTSVVDFELPGPMPLRFRRVWYSVSTYSGPLGMGWHHSLDVGLHVLPEGVIARLADGRYAAFARPQPEKPSWNAREKAWLHLTPKGYVLEGLDRIQYNFIAVADSRDQFTLRKVSDRNGNAIRLKHRDGRLERITDSAGRQLQVLLDDAGRLKQILAPDPMQPKKFVVLVAFAYDRQGNLVETRDAMDAVRSYEYLGRLLTRETDRCGLSFHFEYDRPDERARCVRTWGDGGLLERSLQYDLDAQATVVTDSRGGEARYEWNEMGLVTATRDPLGHESFREWDEEGNRLSETNACGEARLFEYDKLGRCIATIDPDGKRAESVFDELGNLVSFKDEAGATWSHEYDERGNRVATVDPAGGRWEYEHDERGLLVREVDPLGAETKTERTEQGDRTVVTDRMGAQTRFEHDLLGRMVRRIDALGGETKFEWDKAGRLISRTDPTGRVERWSYDPEGFEVEHQDGLNRVRRIERGRLGAIVSVQEPDGALWSYRYDAELALQRIKDPRGRRWRFERDQVGRVMSETSFDGRRKSYERDAAGRITSLSDGNGRRVSFVRDSAGRVARRVFHDGTEEQFWYDPLGRLVGAQNASAELTFKYDALGRVLREVCGDHEATSVYDPAGRRVSRASRLGNKLAFEHDAEGSLLAVSDKKGPLLRLERDALGREVLRTHSNGVVTNRTWTPGSEITSIQTASGSDSLVDLKFTYDAAGGLIETNDAAHGVTRYVHDPSGRLISFSHPQLGVEQFDYDAAGNASGAPEAAREPSESERRTHVADFTLSWDDAGNLTAKEGRGLSWRFEYDGAGRLVAAKRDGLEVRFGYDPLGRRVFKEVAAGDSTTRTDYFWDGDVLLGESTASQAQDAPPRAIENVYLPGSFEPILRLEAGADAVVECNAVGMPLLAVGRDGKVLWQAQHHPFGHVSVVKGQPSLVAHRFAGQTADPETGLVYNRFRFYDPQLRLYLTMDPLDTEGGFQPWNYVRNPLQAIDPFGLQGDCASTEPAPEPKSQPAETKPAPTGATSDPGASPPG